MRKLLVGVGVVSMLLVGCGSEEVSKPKEEPKVTAPKVPNNGLTTDDVLLNMRNTFGDTSDIWYDPNGQIFKISVRGSVFATEVAMIMDGSMSDDSWNDLRESIIHISNIVTEDLGGGYGVAVQNPLNDENTILLVTEGVVLYDAVVAER